MARVVVVTVELTPRQAECLKEIAIGEDMCSEERVRADAFRKLRLAINAAQEAYAATAPDVRPCSTCGAKVGHSRRGLRLPARHKCPHGKDCTNAYASGGFPRCRDCSAARRAASALAKRAEGLSFENSEGTVVATWRPGL